MTKEDWDRAFGCFWFGVECCDIFSSKANFRSSNTKLCYNCLVSVYLLISPQARLQPYGGGKGTVPVAVHNELGWVLLGHLKRQDVDSRQEVLVNFIGQDSVAFDRVSLDSEIHKLWDLESIKSNHDVHESL